MGKEGNANTSPEVGKARWYLKLLEDIGQQQRPHQFVVVLPGCNGVRSRATLMFALIRSKSSAVVASGDGCKFLYKMVSICS